jgi:RNA polymerase-associated protein LEO1
LSSETRSRTRTTARKEEEEEVKKKKKEEEENKMADALVANIFGDSSDSEGEEELLEKKDKNEEEEDGDRRERKLGDEKDDDEDDEIEDVEMAIEDQKEEDGKRNAKVNSVLDEYAGEEKEEKDGEEKEERKGEPMHLIAALNEEEEGEDLNDASDKAIYLNPIVSKATNIFDVCAKKFDENTFQEEEDKTIVDEFGRSRLKAKEGNVARWTRDSLTNELKSNAKFVEWSDGSRTLHLGDEVFNVTETAVSSKQGLNQYVFARHQGLMEGKAKISKRMQFRPATTDSHTHKRLRDAIEKKHGARAKGTMRFVSNVDPEREKEASDRLFEQRAREEAQLQRKRKKMMSEDIRARADGGDGMMRRDGGRDGRYGGGNRSIRGVANELYYDERSRREAELDAAFLEEGAEDELDDENDDFIVPDDDSEDDSGDDEKEKNKEADTPAGERKKRVLVDSDEEE